MIDSGAIITLLHLLYLSYPLPVVAINVCIARGRHTFPIPDLLCGCTAHAASCLYGSTFSRFSLSSRHIRRAWRKLTVAHKMRSVVHSVGLSFNRRHAHIITSPVPLSVKIGISKLFHPLHIPIPHSLAAIKQHYRYRHHKYSKKGKKRVAPAESDC